MAGSPPEASIDEWRSIVTLIVFVTTNLVVLFPFHITLFIPRVLWSSVNSLLSTLRIIPRHRAKIHDAFVRVNFPINFISAPLIADLFLLAILAIGREEVKGGTIGADHISPIDIMVFFISLAYIAISIDASGLIRFLAYKVLAWGGKSGYRLFFLLYVFFSLLGAFIGNDPIILSGTPFLAYMTQASSNIQHPRAWIFTQFSVANIVSAILVSSNPTNLVLAGAFQIRFVDYTVNMIVPVACTVFLLFPILLFVIFHDDKLIPKAITIHNLPDALRQKKPRNPCIPYSTNPQSDPVADSAADADSKERKRLLHLSEIMHPYFDRRSALVGSCIMAVTLIVVLVLNATKPTGKETPVFWITLPAAVLMLVWDLANGWVHRHETRRIAREPHSLFSGPALLEETEHETPVAPPRPTLCIAPPPLATASLNEKHNTTALSAEPVEPATLAKLVPPMWRWARETFPTATFVLAHLPLALIPFAFSMFILVQALVTKGWVPVFAHGWNHWVNWTGTVGAVFGMGLVSVLLCNFAGTNIGTAILLCRVLQAWEDIHLSSGSAISDRTFWASIYSLALGLNFGAFSIALSASLAGLLWHDILRRKHIYVRARDFLRYNVPIIATTMAIGCAVLVGQVYITRKTTLAHI
ncbi:hypothetical protein TD95_002040 [Thielaviopsis punctulata]|uniref:Citrate transporter-like domain-containing protein n=1 Tax=Thielaviopsis punctulata TaxID=72032 RepID=A0A0F4ZH97_9PEZI|nr:hypothetical protein TD95_002040 [Thielaviopsis punctulata]